MSFVPYLFFNGTCAQAMTFYAGVFQTKTLEIMTFHDAPNGAMPDDGDPTRVMHARMVAEGQELLGADMPVAGPAPQNGVSIFHAADTLDRAREIFDGLGDGGTVTMPFAETFWTPGFGMLTDRFGTHWMISVKQD